MNERLTELYRSCRPKEALVSQDQFGSANALLGSEVQKFAELIVRECISIADDYDGVGITIVEKIKQHFGIE